MRLSRLFRRADVPPALAEFLKSGDPRPNSSTHLRKYSAEAGVCEPPARVGQTAPNSTAGAVPRMECNLRINGLELVANRNTERTARVPQLHLPSETRNAVR